MCGTEICLIPIDTFRRVRRLEAFSVKVTVGVEEIHEMQVIHYIDCISINLGRVRLGFASLTPIFCQPVVVFELTLEKSASLIVWPASLE